MSVAARKMGADDDLPPSDRADDRPRDVDADVDGLRPLHTVRVLRGDAVGDGPSGIRPPPPSRRHEPTASATVRRAGRDRMGPGGEGAVPGAPAVVVSTVDGDTVHVRYRGRLLDVRLIGVDTPETVDPSQPVQCFGEAASRFTARRLIGHPIHLEFDVERRDRYGRTLAYVWIGDRLFNRRLVAGGYATVSTYPPDVRYVALFEAAQRAARAAHRGLWRACAAGQGSGRRCDPAYPGVCIPSPPPDLDCADVRFHDFRVLAAGSAELRRGSQRPRVRDVSARPVAGVRPSAARYPSSAMRVDTHLEPILTERLRLRRSRPEDAEDISAYRSDPDVHRYQGWERTDPAGIRAEIEAMAARVPGEPGGWVQFSVEERESGRLVGDVGLSPAEEEPGVIKVGYTIAPAFQGRGYATEAVGALVRYAFDVLEADVVRAYASAENVPSIRVAEKVGMRLMERFEHRYGDEVWFGVRYEIARPDRAEDRKE